MSSPIHSLARSWKLRVAVLAAVVALLAIVTMIGSDRSTVLASHYVDVSAGGDHTCAVTSGGGVQCWGSNFDGKLGNDVDNPQALPVDVIRLSDVRSVSAGSSHSCAVTNSGGVKCWGNGSLIGHGGDEFDDSTAPVDVLGLTSGVAEVSVGRSHTCARTDIGEVFCWGSNLYGELGDGSNVTTNIPVQVIGISQAISVSAGHFYSCVVIENGDALCWGENDEGQLGNGTTNERNVPGEVAALPDVVSISAGWNHTCAVTEGGRAWCWGRNEHLGSGTTNIIGIGEGIPGLIPLPVLGLSDGVTAIAASVGSTCAIVNGGAKCWGGNSWGQLGDGTNEFSGTPVDVVGLESGVDVISGSNRNNDARGHSHFCALTQNGEVKCWGQNASGALGDGTGSDSNVPLEVVHPLDLEEHHEIVLEILDTCELRVTANRKGNELEVETRVQGGLVPHALPLQYRIGTVDIVPAAERRLVDGITHTKLDTADLPVGRQKPIVIKARAGQQDCIGSGFVGLEQSLAPPTADAGGPYEQSEDNVAPVSVTLDGTGSTNVSGTSDSDLSFEWVVDGLFHSSEPVVEYITTGLDGPISLPVQLTVCESAGSTNCDSDSTTINILNVDPIVPVPEVVTDPNDFGGLLDLQIRIVDPFECDGNVVEVDWGDGSPIHVIPIPADFGCLTTIPSHLYADTGIYKINVRLTDDDGGVDKNSLVVRYGDSAPNLLGHWTFDDGTATDISGNGNDGTVNGPIPADGNIGPGSLEFDGEDDHVDLGTLDHAGSGITVAAWVNAEDLANCDASDCRIASKADGTSEQDHHIMLSTIAGAEGVNLRFRLKADGLTTTLIASSGNLANGGWHHVAATYDGADMRVFLDGVEVGDVAKSGDIDSGPAVSFWIGGNPDDPTSRPWDGKIDDVRLYDGALSLAEIETLAGI